MASKAQSIATGCAIAACVVVIAILLLLIALGLMIETGHIPDSAALPAGKIPQRQLRQLVRLAGRREGILRFVGALPQHQLLEITGRFQCQAILVLERVRADQRGDIAQLAPTLEQIQGVPAERGPPAAEVLVEPGRDLFGLERVAHAPIHRGELPLLSERGIQRPDHSRDPQGRLGDRLRALYSG